MNKKDKKKLVFISVIIFFLILCGWLVSWRWQTANISSDEKSKSWQNFLNKIKSDHDILNQRLLGNTASLENLTNSLTEQVDQLKAKSITTDVLAEIEKRKKETLLADWLEFKSDIINFQYPKTWQVEKSDNTIIAREDGQERIRIEVYAQSKDLPDNLSGSELAVWLEQQKQRQVGEWVDYFLLAGAEPMKVYQLVKRIPDQETNLVWRGGQI
ncbi:MAG: hypothetical protein CO133_01810, partial [Candidatus Komeilibacteria bacterium CG_4_9_14_3_um_filter_37_5]